MSKAWKRFTNFEYRNRVTREFKYGEKIIKKTWRKEWVFRFRIDPVPNSLGRCWHNSFHNHLCIMNEKRANIGYLLEGGTIRGRRKNLPCTWDVEHYNRQFGWKRTKVKKQWMRKLINE